MTQRGDSLALMISDGDLRAMLNMIPARLALVDRD